MTDANTQLSSGSISQGAPLVTQPEDGSNSQEVSWGKRGTTVSKCGPRRRQRGMVKEGRMGNDEEVHLQKQRLKVVVLLEKLRQNMRNSEDKGENSTPVKQEERPRESVDGRSTHANQND